MKRYQRIFWLLSFSLKCCHSPHLTPPFNARLAFVALNKLHTSTEAEAEAIVGPLFVSRLTTDIWTPLLLPNFQPLFKRDKGEQASDRPKVTLHHVVLSRPDVGTMRWKYGSEEPVWSELSWRRGGGFETELITPRRAVPSPQLPAGGRTRGSSGARL